ncbi:MAG: hypothetical protein COA58_07440 [Bacteroidetes bacterium]|nr:MAG: hypothetical protein COA58_07440 [Bacteroidota bacterium]
MEAITKLVKFIEDPFTKEEEREKAISELNLLGTPLSDIEEIAYTHWQNYFAENIEDILTKRLVIISHLLPDDVVNQCFENVFQEYRDKRKQMGIDDIRKFWAP